MMTEARNPPVEFAPYAPALVEAARRAAGEAARTAERSPALVGAALQATFDAANEAGRMAARKALGHLSPTEADELARRAGEEAAYAVLNAGALNRRLDTTPRSPA